MLIVTGMSGAGRSTVADALEDSGWYVVDNLPPQMLRPLVDLVERAGTSLPRIAAVVDIRGRDFFHELEDIVASLRIRMDVQLLFLEATDTALVRRFEAVRRPHPLQGKGTLLDGIAAERDRLAELRESADVLIDTSALNVHQLTGRITDAYGAQDAAGLTVTLITFGFKYGLPADADIVADVRFLPNPYWQQNLRPLTGEDPVVAEYVLAAQGAVTFIADYVKSLESVFAGYQRENKRHVTIAVGCTGGKHRSVVMARALEQRILELPDVVVRVRHRDLGRE